MYRIDTYIHTYNLLTYWLWFDLGKSNRAGFPHSFILHPYYTHSSSSMALFSEYVSTLLLDGWV